MSGLGRATATIVYLVLAWIALAALIAGLPWAPEDALTQAGRIVALGVATLVLMAAGVGAIIGLLTLFWGRVPAEPAPRPYP